MGGGNECGEVEAERSTAVVCGEEGREAGRQTEGRVCRKIRQEGRMLQASKAAG